DLRVHALDPDDRALGALEEARELLAREPAAGLVPAHALARERRPEGGVLAQRARTDRDEALHREPCITRPRERQPGHFARGPPAVSSARAGRREASLRKG